ncbi:RNA 2',3'-cyclic phosphodiesterase [Methylomarinum sp. Ch1-1]|uniref:RNA 2',3'-cyclic phosphodiesterase n=1 Tax=Methylomarinum roseum TaxID=3067653 RepID=A0AAU7NUY4_9GAMM|nr:RNA 2',3'-cyclic phosphodiesterase [Methylomarinum sp. Ch1-1]MDP4519178.1 RNA 2',3'-cyclic phosphodiesterase [Methylomarinum sp. Ch1-1]
MKRLFFALWPDEETRHKVVKLNRTIKNDRLRKVKPDNVHITLVFLGSVNAEQERVIREEAGNIVAEPVQIQFDRLTLWRRPGILSLTCTEQPRSLLELVVGLTRIAVGCELDVDKRPYKAHVTLARKARSKPDIEMRPLLWRADRFALVESVSAEDGVHYQVLESWPLIGA